MNLSLFGGTGFILNRFAQFYPNESHVEPRGTTTPVRDDCLYGISTTDNYWPIKGDRERDIDTNLRHLVRVLPNVKGSFSFLSSWFTYAGGVETTPTRGARESDNGRPIGYYSATKLCAELLVESECRTRGVPFRILRLCNVIGGDPRAGKQKNALEHMLRQVVRGDEVTLYTGDCYRSILHVDDVVRAIHLCLERAPQNEIINIGGPSVRMWDLIQHALAVTGSKSKVTLVAPPRFHQTIQVADFWMDTTKLRSLGFVPDMDAYQAVERVLANL